MGSDIFTSSQSTDDKPLITWKDLMVKAWSDKARACPCKGGIPPKSVCMMTYQDCSMGRCPFVVWGCL